jgi:hypothetical protein
MVRQIVPLAPQDSFGYPCSQNLQLKTFRESAPNFAYFYNTVYYSLS